MSDTQRQEIELMLTDAIRLAAELGARLPQDSEEQQHALVAWCELTLARESVRAAGKTANFQPHGAT